MSFRLSVPVALAALLALSSLAPAFGQPPVPVRPRYTQFQNVFGGGRPVLVNPPQGVQGFNVPPGFVNPLGAPQVPQLLFPNQGAVPQALPGAYGVIDPRLATTGIVGTFNNLGHWYGGRTGYYGHWYPNGIASGAGVLGLSGGVGGGFVPVVGPTVGGLGRPGGSLMGTALMGAGAINQFRR